MAGRSSIPAVAGQGDTTIKAQVSSVQYTLTGGQRRFLLRDERLSFPLLYSPGSITTCSFITSITKMGSADESPTDPPILQVIITTTTTITLRIGTIKATLTTEPPTPHTTPCHVAMHMLSTTARPLRGPVPQTCPVLKAVEATERIRETFTGVLFPPITKPVLTDTSDTETGTDRRAPLPLVHRGTTTITPPSPPRHCATERRMVATGQGQVGDRVSD